MIRRVTGVESSSPQPMRWRLRFASTPDTPDVCQTVSRPPRERSSGKSAPWADKFAKCLLRSAIRANAWEGRPRRELVFPSQPPRGAWRQSAQKAGSGRRIVKPPANPPGRRFPPTPADQRAWSMRTRSRHRRTLITSNRSPWKTICLTGFLPSSHSQLARKVWHDILSEIGHLYPYR